MGSRSTTEIRCYRCVAWGRGTCGRSWGCGRRGDKASQNGESKKPALLMLRQASRLLVGWLAGWLVGGLVD